MWSPSSSYPTPRASKVDEAALRDFAREEGVPFEVLEGALLEVRPELSIVEVFSNSTPDSRPRISGRFELLEEVAAGSYGQVFRAMDHELAREVAVKVMRLGDPEVADREARALAALVHPNIVRIYDQGRQDDYRWIVMEWLEGLTLFQWCADKGPREILARYAEAGQGLAAAHRRGLVHRDFKGNNAMLNAEGRAMLVDFGLARSLEALHEQSRDERVVGALPYMAPERLRRQAGDARTDQFAFCASLWEALAGANPFQAGGMDVEGRLEALKLAPRERQKIPRHIRAALERGLAEDPAERWPSMLELLEALEGPPRERRWPLLLVVLMVMVMAAAVSVVIAVEGAPRPGRVALDLPELQMTTLSVFQAIETGDHRAALQAAHEGYSIATRTKAEADFLATGLAVAKWLEAEKKAPEAGEAWMLVSRLGEESGNSGLADKGREKVVEMFKLNLRGTQSPQSK